MVVNFTPLSKNHFPLLLKWLKAPHVNEWYDKNINWDLDKIKEKYGTYVDSYKIEAGIKKPIFANIISVDNKNIGYIQHYNFYDFPREYSLNHNNFPKSMASLDIFIGESNYIGKSIGSLAIKQYLIKYIDPHYDACFVDPVSSNINAIKAYEKCGFENVQNINLNSIYCMIRKNPIKEID